MKIVLIFIASIFFSLSVPINCIADIEAIGIVKSVMGDVEITSLDRTVKAIGDMDIMVGDSVSTGQAGSVGIIFFDDTVVSIGPDSEIVVEEFLFNVSENKHSFITRIIKGTFLFISGKIAKLAPQKVKIETPDATLGIRGTKLLIKVE